MARLLLDNRSSIDAKARFGTTALHWATFAGHKVMVQLLLEKGADIAAETEDRSTALHVAAVRGNGDEVQLLLEKRANVDAKDRKGWTFVSRVREQSRERRRINLWKSSWIELLNMKRGVGPYLTMIQTPCFKYRIPIH